MREYLAQIQSVCDSLAACGNPLSETMHISAILSGLPSEYEPVVAVITSSQQPYKLDGVCGVLLDTEARLQETHSANLVQSSSLGYDGYQFSSSGGPNMFVDQAYYPFVGQVSSGAPITIPQKVFSDSGPYSQNSSFSQRGFQNPSFFHGSGFQSGRSFSRGGRGRFFGGRTRPQCQLCGRIGHLVNRCYYRFDHSYDGYTVNMVEEVVDCPKSEGESFHQEGVVAFVSEDFSPVVCEDATWFPDSGATAHLTPDLGKFLSSSPYTGSGKIIVANGMIVPISHIGSSSLATNSRSLFLSNLLHVPYVNKNLMYVSRFTKDNNVYVEFFPNSCVVKDLGTQQVMLRGLESNGLYKFFSKQDVVVQQIPGSSENYQDSVSCISCSKLNSIVAKHVASVFSISDIELWHRRLGHPSYATLCKTLSMYSFPHINKSLADKSTSSSLIENFRFPKLSLVPKAVVSEQDRAGYSSTSRVPPPLSSEFKFPVKLLVYQKRPKVLLPNQQAESSSMHNQQAESLSYQHDESLSQQQAEISSLSNQQTDPPSLPIQQAVFCFHQEPSTSFSQTSNLPDDVSQLSTDSLSGSDSQVSNLLDDSSDELSKTQECSVRKSSNSQDASEDSQGSSNSLISNIKVGCHPMLTRSKTGSLKNKVCFSAIASVEISEPKTVQQALESKEWSDAVHKEYIALVQK
ncbi:hypothetical protein GQ457_13G027250 [Hibiscus cannabinus]